MDVLQWECGVGSTDVFVKLSPQFDVAVFFGSRVVVCLRHLRGHVERIHTFILIHTTTTAGYRYIYIYKPAGGHQNVRVFVRIVLQRKERSTRGPIHIVSVPEGKNSSVYILFRVTSSSNTGAFILRLERSLPRIRWQMFAVISLSLLSERHVLQRGGREDVTKHAGNTRLEETLLVF